MRCVPLALAAALALTLPAAAQAASLTTYDAVRAGLMAVWADLPLTARYVTLTDGPASGYGVYRPRDGKSVAPGETVYVYFELLGYGFARNADGTQTSRIDVDLELLDDKGNVLASRQNVTQLNPVTRAVPLETYLSLSGTLGNFAPGDYTMRYRLHDRVAAKEGTAEVAITLVTAEPAPASSSAE